MANAKIVLNPDMRSLTIDQVKEELPKTVRQLTAQKAALSQFKEGSAGWLAVAKSHDALLMQGRRYQRFINAFNRAEYERTRPLTQAEINYYANGGMIADLQKLMALIEAL